MVFAVLLEVVRQAVDPLREERDLDFGRACIALVSAELLDQTLLPVDGKRHRRPPIATPQGAVLPRRGGFQNLFFCQEIRREGTTRVNRSKARGVRQEAARAAATSRAICSFRASMLGNFRSSRSRRTKVSVTVSSYRSPVKSRT